MGILYNYYDFPHDITHHHTSIIYTIDNITMIAHMVLWYIIIIP